MKLVVRQVVQSKTKRNGNEFVMSEPFRSFVLQMLDGKRAAAQIFHE
jgi:hypothetical protein